MLVLSRKPGERILIGDDIVIMVIRATGGSVRIGIEAPPDVVILREEVKDRGNTLVAVSAHGKAKG